MPYALLQAHIRALPKITAEQMIRDAMVTAYGGGNMKQEDARGFMKELQREASGGKRKRKPATNAQLREIFGG